MNTYRKALETAVIEARSGNTDLALTTIDSVLDEALLASQSWSSLLVRNAAIFCESGGDAVRACQYLERFVARFGDDARVYFRLANAYSAAGDEISSIRYRNLARAAATKANDLELLEVLDCRERGRASEF